APPDHCTSGKPERLKIGGRHSDGYTGTFVQPPTTESLLALSRQQNPVVILGGGPAGLSAAYELANAGIRSTVLEASQVVGGISRTVEYKGYLFDIGGH